MLRSPTKRTPRGRLTLQNRPPLRTAPRSTLAAFSALLACCSPTATPLPPSIVLSIDSREEVRGTCRPSARPDFGSERELAGPEKPQSQALDPNTAGRRNSELSEPGSDIVSFTARRVAEDRFEVELVLAGFSTRMVQDFGRGYLEFDSGGHRPTASVATLANLCERELLAWGGLGHDRTIQPSRPPDILKFLTFRALLAIGEVPSGTELESRVTLSLSLREFEKRRLRAHRNRSSSAPSTEPRHPSSPRTGAAQTLR